MSHVERQDVTPARVEKMWTVDELAEFAAVSATTPYDWPVRAKRLKAVKIGSCLRYLGGDVVLWLDELGTGVA